MPRLPALSPVSTGIGLMLTAVILFTLMDATAKGLIAQYGTLQVIWARYTGQTVLVAILLGPRLLTFLRTRYLGLHLLRSVFQFGATALFFASLSVIGLAEATAIMDINPVLITLGAFLVLGEKIGPRRVFGVLVALIGALIIIRPGTAVFSPAALLPLAASVCYAAYAIVTRKVGTSEPVWTALIYTALVGTVITTAALPTVWQTPALADLPAFLAIGVLGSVAQLCLIRAFSLVEAAVLAPFGYVGLLFATLWGVVFFNEYPDIWVAVGGTLIVAAGLYVWYRETRVRTARGVG